MSRARWGRREVQGGDKRRKSRVRKMVGRRWKERSAVGKGG